MTQRKVVLLVEDNPDDEELVLLAFETSEISHQVVVVRDGVQALDYLFSIGTDANHSGKAALPALILLDLHLPKIDGLEVLQRVRADNRTKLLPVVIMTTSNNPQDLRNSYGFGCNSYIRKPVNSEQFMAVVQQLGIYWLTINLPPPVFGAI